MLELKHPSAFELEAWTVGEQTAAVEQHIQSCTQCRNIVDTLEIDRQEFLEEEGPAEFLNRTAVADLIANQIKDNKERRRLESRAELSQGLPYDAESVIVSKPSGPGAVIDLDSNRWLVKSLLVAVVSAAIILLILKIWN